MSTKKLIDLIQGYYQTKEYIPLHAPIFGGNERKYVLDTLDSTFVSSVGAYVDRFEKHLANYTKAKHAVATVNGTAALHTALFLSGVQKGDLVITQALTFVATCNAISYLGAEPVFVDVNLDTLGLCPKALSEFLDLECEVLEQACFHNSGKRIRAVVVMHTFGHPAKVDLLKKICEKYFIELIEDAAESLGSLYNEQHTGTFSSISALSFNGNKVITTGGGGMILCDSAKLASRAKHITTTAKQAHPFEFYHDEVAFNYRMPNINAALGCGQFEQLENYIIKKRELANFYLNELKGTDFEFFQEPTNARSNYWLNAIICPSKKYRDVVLNDTNCVGVMTRPVWNLMHKLPMYQACLKGPLPISEKISELIVNLPSTPHF